MTGFRVGLGVGLGVGLDVGLGVVTDRVGSGRRGHIVVELEL